MHVRWGGVCLHTLESTSYVDTGSYCLMTHCTEETSSLKYDSWTKTSIFQHSNVGVIYFSDSKSCLYLLPNQPHPLKGCVLSLQGILTKWLLYLVKYRWWGPTSFIVLFLKNSFNLISAAHHCIVGSNNSAFHLLYKNVLMLTFSPIYFFKMVMNSKIFVYLTLPFLENFAVT